MEQKSLRAPGLDAWDSWRRGPGAVTVPLQPRGSRSRAAALPWHGHPCRLVSAVPPSKPAPGPGPPKDKELGPELSPVHVREGPGTAWDARGAPPPAGWSPPHLPALLLAPVLARLQEKRFQRLFATSPAGCFRQWNGRFITLAASSFAKRSFPSFGGGEPWVRGAGAVARCRLPPP